MTKNVYASCKNAFPQFQAQAGQFFVPQFLINRDGSQGRATTNH